MVAASEHPQRLDTFAASQRWRRLIPLVFITYSLAYLDRSNYSIGVAGGLEDELHITAGTSALLGALFFLGYFLFQIPAAHYAENRSVRRLIFWCVLVWGVLATAQGVIPWVWLLMVDRFLLGVVEAAIMPALLIFLTHWFSRSERGRANTFLILGNPVTVMWLSAVSGWIIHASSWRWMFIIEGVPAIIWAFVFRAVIHDRPHEAPWLHEPERRELEERLRLEQADLQGAPRGYLEAFRSRNVIVLSLQYLFWSIGVYGFVFWLPTILDAAEHRGIGQIGLLSAAPYAAAAIAMVLASRYSDRSGNRREFVWPFLLGATILFVVSILLGTTHYWVSYAVLILVGAGLYAPYGPYFALIPEFLPQQVSGAAMALVNSAGALGGFAGAYAVGWLQGSLGNNAAYTFMAAALAASALLMFLVDTRGRRGAEVRAQPTAPAEST